MSSRLRQRADMNILRISLARWELQGEGQSEVVFELTSQGEITLRSSVPASELGLAGRSKFIARRFRYRDADFKLPVELGRQLREYLPPQEFPLWIELVRRPPAS